MKLLPYAMHWFQTHQEWCAVPNRTEIWSQSQTHRVEVGRPSLARMLYVFESHPKAERQCLIPHFKKAGPNELLVFERGPNWRKNGLLIGCSDSKPHGRPWFSTASSYAATAAFAIISNVSCDGNSGRCFSPRRTTTTSAIAFVNSVSNLRRTFWSIGSAFHGFHLCLVRSCSTIQNTAGQCRAFPAWRWVRPEKPFFCVWGYSAQSRGRAS